MFPENPFHNDAAKNLDPDASKMMREVFGDKKMADEMARLQEKRGGGRVKEAKKEPDWSGTKFEISDAERAAALEKERQRKRETLREGEFLLENVPEMEEIPTEEEFKDKVKGYKLNWWDSEFYEGRELSEFELTRKDLEEIKLDKKTQASILDALEEARDRRESILRAKIFDIGKLIGAKQKTDTDATSLTTKEVLEAIDAAGYRPATFQELLAYGRDYWKPDADPKTLTDEEKLLQRAKAPYIYALGSPFLDSGGKRYVSGFYWSGDGRGLTGDVFADDWNSGYRFLVIRKSI